MSSYKPSWPTYIIHMTAGHPGYDKTIRKTKKLYPWPRMNDWIADYIKGCAICQQNKNLTHWKKVPLYRITISCDTWPFQQVAMDLIMGLPPQNGKDTILTIVDHRCSYAAVFLPCATMIIGPGIAQLYLHNVYQWFGLPNKVISDHDPRFTFHFGKALIARLRISQNLSLAFHPQANCLSEWKNQWIEQYLQLVTSSNPKDWTQWLDLASTVHNNQRNTTTKLFSN